MSRPVRKYGSGFQGSTRMIEPVVAGVPACLLNDRAEADRYQFTGRLRHESGTVIMK